VVVRIVADDLTGALDTAAPFAAAMGPFPVFWDLATRRSGSYALDTETREQSDDRYDWVAHLDDVELPFKKIDSLLRGRTAQEILACLERGAFPSAIIAPAFPAQERITRNGRQHWRAASSEPWQPVACDLLTALRERLPIRHAASAAMLAGSGWFLCDAESEDDLRAVVEAGKSMAQPVLWCGSAGLARTLAGPPRSDTAFPPRAPILILIGSQHSVSRAQHEAIEAHRPGMVTGLASTERGTLETAIAKVAEAIAWNTSSVLAMDLPAGAADAARQVLDATFELITTRMSRPGCLFVTGGETLFGLLRALDATSLLATGELMPGVPLSRIAGGRWHDLQVISKSGGFGAPDLLIRLAESVMP
jgi:uncharacterized protein YgbK (DUF1537 family)